MKKTIIATALLTATSGAAQAQYFDLTGTFEMRDPTGMLAGSDPITGSLEQNMITGSGTADIINNNGSWWPVNTWTMHDISFQMMGPAAASFDILMDWGVVTNIHVTMDMSVTVNGDGSIDFITLDGPSADGIPGNPMDNGPFPEFNAALNMTATPVPVPAAVWLFGSGLIGLIGIAKRK